MLRFFGSVFLIAAVVLGGCALVAWYHASSSLRAHDQEVIFTAFAIISLIIGVFMKAGGRSIKHRSAARKDPRMPERAPRPPRPSTSH